MNNEKLSVKSYNVMWLESYEVEISLLKKINSIYIFPNTQHC